MVKIESSNLDIRETGNQIIMRASMTWKSWRRN